MSYDLKLINEKINKWDYYLNEYKLPSWEMLPTIGLYMDQIVTLMNEYLGILPIAEGKNNQDVITASTINNYVRLGVIPAPIKKKYMRKHIAYLIIICTLKITFSISEIASLIKPDLTEEEMEKIYTHYVNMHKETSLNFAKRVMKCSEEFSEENSDRDITDMIATFAIESTFTKMLYLKVTRLDNVSYEDGTSPMKIEKKR